MARDLSQHTTLKKDVKIISCGSSSQKNSSSEESKEGVIPHEFEEDFEKNVRTPGQSSSQNLNIKSQNREKFSGRPAGTLTAIGKSRSGQKPSLRIRKGKYIKISMKGDQPLGQGLERYTPLRRQRTEEIQRENDPQDWIDIYSDEDEALALEIVETTVDIWVDFPKFPLKLDMGQKSLITDPYGWLDCSIISGMMLTLKVEFPRTLGLQYTQFSGLYTVNPITKKYDETNRGIPRFRALPSKGFFVQILYLQTRNHWICVSADYDSTETITINVYDSLNSNILNHELISQVSSFFKNHPVESFDFVFHKVSHQLDGSSCGVHSIANALLLSKGGLPERHIYLRDEMRSYLVFIIENGIRSQSFPSYIFDNKSRKTTIKAVPVYCYCRQKDDKTEMVQCNRCFEWFHLRCIDSQIDMNSQNWFCEYCSKRRHIILS